MLLLLAAALPVLLWNGPANTAPAAARELSAGAPDLRNVTKVPAPAVQYRMNIASATRSPWLVSNGWRFLRNPRGRYLYDVEGPQAALAAAEAFCFGVNAFVRTGETGLKPFAEMVAFLRGLGVYDAPAVADIGFLDPGDGIAGEVMNMLVRDNLLFKVVPRPDPRLKLTVRLGSKEFPLEDAKNPSLMAHEIRARLTDERRAIRIYGSPVVVARLTALPDGIRVHLLNYAGAERKVDGLRVRVLGKYSIRRVAAEGAPDEKLLDTAADDEAIEFTLPELKTYAVIDLSR